MRPMTDRQRGLLEERHFDRKLAAYLDDEERDEDGLTERDRLEMQRECAAEDRADDDYITRRTT